MRIFNKFKNSLDKPNPWIAIFIVLFAAIVGAILGAVISHYLWEQETYSKLQLSFVDYQIHYDKTTTEVLELKPMITLYNSKRSDYPARVKPIKSQIIDDETTAIVGEGVGGLENPIVLSGDSITVLSIVSMELNKTGNYTIQTTVEYLDIKSGLPDKIEFYGEFYSYPTNEGDNDLYFYKIRFKETGILNERWHLGKKYDL